MMNYKIIDLMTYIYKSMISQCLVEQLPEFLAEPGLRAQTHKLEQDSPVLKVVCYPLIQES